MRVQELWKFYRGIDMQQVSHFGDNENSSMWDSLRLMNSARQLDNDEEAQNLIHAIRIQYAVGFTGRAKRGKYK